MPTETDVCLVSLSPEAGTVYKYTMTGPAMGQEETFVAPVEISEKSLICVLHDTDMVISHVKDPAVGEYGLGVWDLKFNAIKAWQAYPKDSDSTPAYLTVINDNLVVGTSSGVYVSQVSVSPSTLSAVLGSLTSSSTFTASTESENHLKGLVDPLLDTKKTKEYKTFKEAFGRLMKGIAEDPENSLLIRQELNKLTTRCLEEKQFFPHKELLQLIKKSLVPASLCLEVVEKLANVGDINGIQSCLAHIHNIPESIIVQCLQFVLGMEDSKFPGGDSDEMRDEPETQVKDSEHCNLPPGKAVVVNSILIVPVSEVFLLESLKLLDFDKAMQLISYLR